MKKSVLFLLIYMLSSIALAQNVGGSRLLDMIASQVSSQERLDLWKAQVEVENMLPPLMKQRLMQKRPKNGYRLFAEDFKEHVAGSSNRKGEMRINKSLLKNRPLLIKTMIHEWAHIYDFINFHSMEVLSHASWCDTYRDDREMNTGECDLYFDLKTTVSTTAEFQEIGGWFLNLSGKGARIRQTSFNLRSPDKYEQASKAEMFAVNMEYFLTDREYQCRRPTMHRYLSEHFGYNPFPLASCGDYLKIVDPSFTSADRALATIDKRRLYQVHYLLASRGDGISGKFGHSMFRLVMCAPSRKVMGPDCLKDIQYHLVLSYRAFVNTPEISNLAGLGGDYPSRLFFIPFAQVIEEYNKTELRDLMSYPLALSRQEMNQFVDRAVETHWGYDGQYYFLSNNCAVESINLLRSATLRKELMTESAQTPYSLRNLLARAKLTQKEYMDNREWAVKNGYLFISHGEHLEKALEFIDDYVTVREAQRISDWVELTPGQRRYLFQKHMPQDRRVQVKYAAAFLLLENYAEKESESGLQGFLLKLLKSSNLEQGLADTLRQILAIQSGFFESKGQLTTPAQMLNIGYGLPSPKEYATMQKQLESIAKRKNESKSILADLYERIFKPEQFSIVKQIRYNKDLYTQTILKR
ncbi:DUF4105 domain-containing protein [Bdellovibrio sp. 22V]|uniref:DUF7844 domain-containing protein n=1 Tax=Bdellovibrio TaxID=958 RepID=UPI002542CDE1|nr:DUF4105 domain-containing protein [Bdellovibrio sp. 22V]WII73376.1 DUF4105 domain-containing protein [Bdellovibrio sp. 22V]